MDCSLPGSSVHGISQARILEWVAIPYSRGSSQPRAQTQISCISCIGRQMLYHCATWEAWLGLLFIYLAVPGLSCGTQAVSLVAVCELFPCGHVGSRFLTRDQIHVSCVSCISRQILTTSAPGKPLSFTRPFGIKPRGFE